MKTVTLLWQSISTVAFGIAISPLVAWSKSQHKDPGRLQIVVISAGTIGVFYGYTFVKNLSLHTHFSATGLLIGFLGLFAGAICGAMLPKRILPVWQPT